MKFRLLRAHQLGYTLPGGEVTHAVCLGEMEVENLPENNRPSTIVGDGTPWVVRWPTLDMEALDEEAEEALEKERNRLLVNDGAMNPIEALSVDPYDKQYIAGSGRQRRVPPADGAPVEVPK